jgi:ATP-dependent DNA ligase
MPTRCPPASPLPTFLKPPLALLRDEAAAGEVWVHEIKLDGYRIHARIDGRDVRLLTCSRAQASIGPIATERRRSHSAG